jgi:hypothetical protein
MQAFGINEKQQRSLMRAFGVVLGTCMRKGRYACNTYMLSKSLLQRLLRQELPPGILPLSEEFPDAYEVSNTAAVSSLQVAHDSANTAFEISLGTSRSLGG